MDTINRAIVAIAGKSDADLQRFLGATKSGFAAYRKHNTLPVDECVKVAQQTGVSLDWLITGNGEMRRSLDMTAADAATHLPAEQQMLLSGWASLDKAKQDYIFALIFQLARSDASVWSPQQGGDTTINIAGDVAQANAGIGLQKN